MKNASNKSCSALNCVQKSQWESIGAYAYLPQKWKYGPQRLPSLKYYNVQKWESRFFLGHDAAKNTQHIQKYFK